MAWDVDRTVYAKTLPERSQSLALTFSGLAAPDIRFWGSSGHAFLRHKCLLLARAPTNFWAFPSAGLSSYDPSS